MITSLPSGCRCILGSNNRETKLKTKYNKGKRKEEITFDKRSNHSAQTGRPGASVWYQSCETMKSVSGWFTSLLNSLDTCVPKSVLFSIWLASVSNQFSCNGHRYLKAYLPSIDFMYGTIIFLLCQKHVAGVGKKYAYKLGQVGYIPLYLKMLYFVLYYRYYIAMPTPMFSRVLCLLTYVVYK